MSDEFELDAEMPKQDNRPILWFLGFMVIMFVGAVIYGTA